MMGHDVTDVTRKKISVKLTGNKNPLGKKRTPEQLKNYSFAQKRRYAKWRRDNNRKPHPDDWMYLNHE